MISQKSEIDSAVKASFHTIEKPMSAVCTMGNLTPNFMQNLILFKVQYHHNLQLKQDAAASLGTNHVIFKVAALFVEVIDKQMAMTNMEAKEIWEERTRLRELELLKWAGIDISTRTV